MRRKFGLTAPEITGLGRVTVEPAVRLALLAAARSTPGEACAALYGGIDGPALLVGGWRHLENAEPGGCLAISVADLLAEGGTAAVPRDPAAVPRDPAAGGESAGPGRLIGLFHSHPAGEAVPSDLDCVAIARLPFVWGIAGGRGQVRGSLRFFAWSGAGVRELQE